MSRMNRRERTRSRTGCRRPKGPSSSRCACIGRRPKHWTERGRRPRSSGRHNGSTGCHACHARDPGNLSGAVGDHPGSGAVFAFGNSDGDQQMLEWTAAGDGARFMGLVHHTDAEREWAYDRNSHVGKLDKALDEANTRGWTVVDMKNDWKVVFPPEK